MASPKFQKRHYADIAGLIARLHAEAIDRGDMFTLETVAVIRDRLLETFTRDNPRFSPVRFVQACEAMPIPQQATKRTQR